LFSNIFQSSSTPEINTTPYIIIRKLQHSVFNKLLEILLNHPEVLSKAILGN